MEATKWLKPAQSPPCRHRRLLSDHNPCPLATLAQQRVELGATDGDGATILQEYCATLRIHGRDQVALRGYLALSFWGRLRYRVYRHPLVLFGFGPAYLFILQQRLPIGLLREGWQPWLSAMATNAAIASASTCSGSIWRPNPQDQLAWVFSAPPGHPLWRLSEFSTFGPFATTTSINS